MKFGDTLRSLLEERFLTQKQMANDLNIAPTTINGYVLNSSEPDFETLKRIAKYFNTTTDYLLDHRTGNAKTHEEDNIIRIFRSLTIEQKEIFTEQSKVYIKINEKNKKATI